MVGFRPSIHVFFGHRSDPRQKKSWMVATSATMTALYGAIDGAKLLASRVAKSVLPSPAYLMITWWANS
jgi:hypothetical protein